MTARRRLRGDTGSAAVEFPLAVSFLLLPIAVIVMTVPQWPERVSVTRSMAREAATLYATAGSEAAGRDAARRSVNEAAANWGFDPATVALGFEGSWCRACTVRVNVTTPVPALQVPFIGEVGGFEYTGSATARIDDYGSID